MKDERSQRLILKAIRATEMHMAQSCIAMEILQGISIHSVGKLDLGSAALPKNAFPGKGIRRRAYGSLAEIFFPVYEKTAGIIYNTNNSWLLSVVNLLLSRKV